MRTDYLLRATSTDGSLRVLVATTTALCAEAQARHDTSATASAALGRTLTAAALFASMLKEGEAVTLRIIGDGAIGGIVADADAAGNVRGYVQEPHADLPPRPNGKLNVGGVVGSKGHIHVTRDLKMRAPYTGSAPLVSGEIAEDVSNYLLVSEQTPSVVALGVLVERDLSVRAAGGFILQALPGATDETLKAVEANVALLPNISGAIDEGITPEGILRLVLSGIEYDILARQPLRFHCPCDRARVERALISLGKADLAEMADADHPVNLKCHFCGEQYEFQPAEVQALMAKATEKGH